MARTYTDDEKAEAVAVYVEHGLAEAARRTGIPKPTLSNWVTPEQRSAQAERSAAKTAAATAAHRRWIEEQRIVAQREFMETAVHCARQARLVEDGHQAFSLTKAGGTALDKVRLELGEVTDRTEHRTVDQVTAEVERLAEEMAQR